MEKFGLEKHSIYLRLFVVWLVVYSLHYAGTPLKFIISTALLLVVLIVLSSRLKFKKNKEM